MNRFEKVEQRPLIETEHKLMINNRNEVEISGVNDVDSFDNEEFLLATAMGYLVIRGKELQMQNLDVEAGNVLIKGKIYELTYVDNDHDSRAKGLFSRLFK